jgi:hypothetical protein
MHDVACVLRLRVFACASSTTRGGRTLTGASAQRPPEANALATAATRSERTRSRELTPRPAVQYQMAMHTNTRPHTADSSKYAPRYQGQNQNPAQQCAGAILGVPSGIRRNQLQRGVVRRGGGEPPVTPQLARPRARAAQPERSSRSSPLDGLQVWGFKDARRRDSSRALCGAVAKASRRAGD